MNTDAQLIARFESCRPHLLAVAARLLGDRAGAEDVVQEAWLRLSRPGATDLDAIANIDGWMTTVVARTSLNALRARGARPEYSVAGIGYDIVVRPVGENAPEDQAILAEQVAFALDLVLRRLSPPERLAFILHDSFGMAFTDIAGLLGKSIDATRKIASRARNRVRAFDPAAMETDPAGQRAVVDAFFSASMDGDLDALVDVLHPDVGFYADGGATRPEATATLHGRRDVSRRAAAFAVPGASLCPVTINGAQAVLVQRDDQVRAAMAFTISEGRILQIYSLLDDSRLRQLIRTLPG
ncbi:sigma-70 family RNA polymerase sigma factor [Tsukamurella sp. 8F]|uniref:sigma-70 family RNA polymerase sigma factor n=1 Tax=unclassified Tsukamurella TaxID=2633480 RepID=UPI0023B89E4D|nr:MULTISPECIES: sigma-70 family RNA polymerase sigma factor [unclassified Tsukamurella]MDF0531559.1 sigma-70 family RNA polymerase sigma factor [Tsukamurella sp. 8J]MDF0588829.1 sigma-70 family RNA polymerase sigma factor [Tsukamurella sp. 8F]